MTNSRKEGFAFLAVVCVLLTWTLQLSVSDDLFGGSAVAIAAQQQHAWTPPALQDLHQAKESTLSTLPPTFVDNSSSHNNSNSSSSSTNSSSNDTAEAIITSQLQAVNAQSLLEHATLYYSRFGDLQPPWPMTECQGRANRTCTQIVAAPAGDELVTLQSLYDYCVRSVGNNVTNHHASQQQQQQQQQRPHRVVYMHSKGTFTPTRSNHQLRTLDMTAITSSACLELGHTNETTTTSAPPPLQCNVCGVQFFEQPMHFTGNMWVADCAYVVQLIPPRAFGAAKQRVQDRMMAATTRVEESDKLYQTTFPDGTHYEFGGGKLWQLQELKWWNYLGLGRFAGEHWISSHPTLQPCEALSQVDGNPVFSYDTSAIPALVFSHLRPRLRRAPTGIFSDYPNNQRFHPWYQRVGKLQQYKALYGGQVPPVDSWFYAYWKGWPLVGSWRRAPTSFTVLVPPPEEEDAPINATAASSCQSATCGRLAHSLAR